MLYLLFINNINCLLFFLFYCHYFSRLILLFVIFFTLIRHSKKIGFFILFEIEIRSLNNFKFLNKYCEVNFFLIVLIFDNNRYLLLLKIADRFSLPIKNKSDINYLVPIINRKYNN